MSSGLIARQIQELDESFAAGPALRPQTSREVDQDPEGGLTTQCNGGLCVFVLFLVYIFDHKTTVAGGAAAAGGAGGALRPGASLVTVDVYTSARSLFLSLRADGARQVRLACAKPQTSREVDQDPEGGLTRQCNTRPSFLIMCCV